MKATEVLKRIMTELSAKSVVEVKFEQMKLDNGTVLEADSFEAGNEVFIVNEEERIAVPVGEYTMDDSRVLIVLEEGIIAEIREASIEEEVAPEVEVEVEASESATPKKVIESHTVEQHFAEEEVVVEESPIVDKVKAIIMPLIDEIRAELSAMREEMGLTKDKMSEVEKENGELKTELSSQSAAKPIKHNPEGGKKAEVKLGKRPATSFDRVLAKLNN